MIPRALDVILMAQALSEFHGVDGMTGGGNTDQASKWPDEDQALFQDQAEWSEVSPNSPPDSSNQADFRNQAGHHTNQAQAENQAVQWTDP